MPAFFVALRYLLGRAGEGGRYLRGAAAGIALSLIPIIVTLIVADGMIRGITDRYLELGTGHIRAYRYVDSGMAPPAGLDELPGIRGVWQERQGLGIVLGSRGKTGTSIRAVDPRFLADPGSRRFLKVIEGSAELDAPNQVLLGEDLAQNVGAEVGKTIYIMSIRRTAAGRNLPRTLSFVVSGIVSSGYRELDSLWCIMSYEGGARILAPEYANDFLTIKIDDPYRQADEAALALTEVLGPGYGIYTWKELQRSQYSSYESTRQLLLFIMAMIVVVAAVNVSSATSMLVIERRRDIAVLKAGGASPAATSRIFLVASFLTGLTGALLGIALGLLIGRFINPLIRALEVFLSFFSGLFQGGEVKILDPGYYLEAIPVIIDGKTVLVIGIFTVLCSILASWIPARRAGKLKPMEILRRF
jgi:lipoprotein-releasing system permease protein